MTIMDPACRFERPNGAALGIMRLLVCSPEQRMHSSLNSS